MTNSNILDKFIIEICNGGFTDNQMKSLLVNTVRSMTEYEAEAFLNTIGMRLSDVA